LCANAVSSVYLSSSAPAAAGDARISLPHPLAPPAGESLFCRLFHYPRCATRQFTPTPPPPPRPIPPIRSAALRLRFAARHCHRARAPARISNSRISCHGPFVESSKEIALADSRIAPIGLAARIGGLRGGYLRSKRAAFRKWRHGRAALKGGNANNRKSRRGRNGN